RRTCPDPRAEARAAAPARAGLTRGTPARALAPPHGPLDALGTSPKGVLDLSSSAAPQPLVRRRRITVGVLLALAVVTGFVAIFATWVKRQALDTGNWENTSGDLIA